ncbi:MAG: hypothetical protein LBL76_06525 [Treponema sp.]|nr:hypothetical protein [Treponema sp.]
MKRDMKELKPFHDMFFWLHWVCIDFSFYYKKDMKKELDTPCKEQLTGNHKED